MLLRVLLAVRDQRRRLQKILESCDAAVELASGGPGQRPLLEAWLQGRACDLVLASPELLDELPAAANTAEGPPCIALTDCDDPEQHNRWLAAGYLNVVSTAVPDPVLREALLAAVNRRRQMLDRRLTESPDVSAPKLSDFDSRNPAMQAFINVVRRVAPSDASLLITGETGVGKERLARAIHQESPRRNGPFITVNCGALPESLLESELFGHEQGAFTGASRMRRGWFELAHQGLIFLDEIGEMPHHLQVKLLHILQNHELQRVGGEETISVDVRVIAATNRELLAEVQQQRFRRDLYYRLGVVNLTIPPLRERTEDILEIADGYLQHFRGKIGRNVLRISEAAGAAMRRYAWPGNIRELINVVERAVLLCDGEEIGLADLPTVIGGDPGAETELATWNPPQSWLEQPLKAARRQASHHFEAAYLKFWLAKTRGRIGETARLIGIDARSLFTKMKRHGLKKEDFRDPS